MDGLDTAAGFMDGLLNFSSDEEDDDEGKTRLPLPAPPSPSPAPKMDRSAPELIEELEWLSNKDAFPEIETFLPGGFPLLKQQSPVSVLETSHGSARATIISCCTSFQIPVKARSKGRRRRTYPTVPDSDQCQRVSQEKKERPTHLKTASARKCQHCQSEKTPQWRAGPNGPKTLCNACGVRYKSGRLVPEYRPASSPTFSSKVHSNSHRKIMEMRRLREAETG